MIYLSIRLFTDTPNPTISTCTRYTLKQLQQATDNWSQASFLGSGTFGTVYRGIDPMDPNTQWAVKRAKLRSGDFRKEVREGDKSTWLAAH